VRCLDQLVAYAGATSHQELGFTRERVVKHPCRIVAWLGAALLLSSSLSALTVNAASAATIVPTSTSAVMSTQAAEAGATVQLGPSTFDGEAVSFYLAAPSATLRVSGDNLILIAPLGFAPDTLIASLFATDASGDTGAFTFSLTVSRTITQTAPTTNSTTTGASSAFTDQLQPATISSGGVTFFPSSVSAGLSVSTSGALSTTGALAPGTYTAAGTDSDTDADTGSWTYTLLVGVDIGQVAPLVGSSLVSGSGSFTDQLEPTTFGGNAVVFATSTSDPDISVSTTGVITTTGTLAGGTYALTGTDSDAVGDAGSWSYAFTVSGVTVHQSAPLVGSSTVYASGSFVDQLEPITFDGNAVTFVTSSADAGISISTAGAVSTSGPLSPATYTATGTDGDSYGDTGSWSYALTVSRPSSAVSRPTSVTLVQTSPTVGTTTTANSATFSPGPVTVSGAVGAVTFVTGSSSPAVFVDAHGVVTTSGSLNVGTYSVSGTDSDAKGDNGTWTFSLTVSASSIVTFVANGARGAMVAQTGSVATALTLNGFSWTRRTFKRWNTAANGLGTSYANGGTYSFTTSVTLYAQWKVARTRVSFSANGGKGAMSPETKGTRAALRRNAFTRRGYRFVTWNTAINGSGSSYANGATYGFTKTIRLFAQWRRVAS
jgi:hypothetical protein